MSRRPARRTGLLVVVLAAVAPACQPAAIRPDNRPTPLPGARNGEVPDAALIEVAPGCRVALPAAPSLEAVLQAAHRDGVDLRPASCYRDLAGQRRERARWCAAGRCGNAAVPGTSTHGWGKAVDLTEPGGLRVDSAGYRWLRSRAGFFGWNHPGWAEPAGAAPEPWHWEWVGDGGTLAPGGMAPA